MPPSPPQDVATLDPLGLVGKVVDDAYEVSAVAGVGGFSVVYQARQLDDGRAVAVKVFNVVESVAPELCEKLLADFLQEGQVIRALCHQTPSIVQAHDSGKLTISDDDWLPYLVLEWLEGAPLSRVIAQERTADAPARSLQEAMSLLAPVAQALEVAHAQSVAHRDLKPANIMVLGDPREPQVAVKLLDFGIAKVMAAQQELVAQLKMTGKHVTPFTAEYGAPEQFSRSYGATGPWTDVYAMALILEELMLGERALAGDSYFELGSSSCDEQARPTPASLGINLSDELEAVFAKALAVAPPDRFASMEAFWSALGGEVAPRAQQPLPCPSQPQGEADRDAEQGNRDESSTKTRLTAIVVAVVVALAALFFLLARWG